MRSQPWRSTRGRGFVDELSLCGETQIGEIDAVELARSEGSRQGLILPLVELVRQTGNDFELDVEGPDGELERLLDRSEERAQNGSSALVDVCHCSLNGLGAAVEENVVAVEKLEDCHGKAADQPTASNEVPLAFALKETRRKRDQTISRRTRKHAHAI
jgi:hypothetical protein